MQVGEGEQHAGLVADLDRLAAEQHRLVPPVLHQQAALHLRDGMPGMQALDGEVAAFGAAQHVDLVHGVADQRVLHVAGQLEEAGVDLDVAHVREADDDGGRRVGGEGALEAFLGVEALGLVVEDDHEAVGFAVGVGEHHGADLVHPALAVGAAGDLGEGAVDGLAVEQELDRVFLGAQRLAAAVGDLEAFGVTGCGAAEVRQGFCAVQFEGGVVGPGERAVGVHEDEALGEAGDDLLQVGGAGVLGWNGCGQDIYSAAKPRLGLCPRPHQRTAVLWTPYNQGSSG